MGGRFDREKARARARAMQCLHRSPRCSRCGARDSHFVPPGMGDKGFFICDVDARFRGRTVAQGVMFKPEPR